jgi:hypothetical protein
MTAKGQLESLHSNKLFQIAPKPCNIGIHFKVSLEKPANTIIFRFNVFQAQHSFIQELAD